MMPRARERESGTGKRSQVSANHKQTDSPVHSLDGVEFYHLHSPHRINLIGTFCFLFVAAAISSILFVCLDDEILLKVDYSNGDALRFIFLTHFVRQQTQISVETISGYESGAVPTTIL